MKPDQNKLRDAQPVTLPFKVAFDGTPETAIDTTLFAFDARGKPYIVSV